ncbi:hypothetical protein MSG28_014397 [Choristoneura fumiferana]|uniref:Uncharacterized protein n=1 Tax=Choristoneura fumiferana TaxID=7141 RepID=A0ACC0JRL7_CHOFU|nr:hypothetical protein MSG28_014397 [Choristoneura fumiferana]
MAHCRLSTVQCRPRTVQCRPRKVQYRPLTEEAVKRERAHQHEAGLVAVELLSRRVQRRQRRQRQPAEYQFLERSEV